MHKVHYLSVDGSPYEVKKLSLTGGGLVTKMKMLAKWRNCQGTMINKDGSQYVGEFQSWKIFRRRNFHLGRWRICWRQICWGIYER